MTFCAWFISSIYQSYGRRVQRVPCPFEISRKRSPVADQRTVAEYCASQSAAQRHQVPMPRHGPALQVGPGLAHVYDEERKPAAAHQNEPVRYCHLTTIFSFFFGGTFQNFPFAPCYDYSREREGAGCPENGNG